jgi:hypothetical protein
MNGAELRVVWRSLVRIYPEWTIVLDFFFNPSTYRLWGVDLLRGPLLDSKSRKVAAALSRLSASDADAIAKLAAINVQRASNLATAMGVAYISLPLALGALASDLATDTTRAYVAANIEVIAVIIGGLALGPLSYFFSMWRARQLLWTVELAMAGALTE